MAHKGFTGTQKQYLEGLASGLRVSQRNGRSVPAEASTRAAAVPPSPPHPDQALWDAQDRFILAGQRLSMEEKAKRRQPPEDLWAAIARLARDGRFPEAEEVFLYKYQGLFYVSPVEESFMCRLRFAAGRVTAHQLRSVADLAERHGHPMLQLTTRSSLQLRGIGARSALDVLHGLSDLGIISRGTGGDGVRNVSASPTAGFDRRELIDAGALARQVHHLVLSKRALQALPRKLTVAFDGGGSISALPETCDLGFRAVTVRAGAGVEPGVYFRLLLGGATSHGRYGRDAGVLVAPAQCLDVLEQVLHIYIEHGDRTNRRRARLLYLVESWGMPRFVAELQLRLTQLWAGRNESALPTLTLERCELPAPPDPFAHVGFHNQKPRGKSYVGVVLQRGQLSVLQARGLADIADELGSGELRLTPQQNLLIPGLKDTQLHRVKDALAKLALSWSASSFRSGLVACTGSSGCQFSAGDVKRRGEELVRHLESQFKFSQPLTIHISGCHHACAQHLIADIGLLAMRGPSGDSDAECYQLWLGGQSTNNACFGREFASNVPAGDVPRVVQGVVDTYFERRHAHETFREFVRRIAPPDLELWAAEQRSARSGGAIDRGTL
jgi:ferredoxin-nitrite reductase